MWQAERSLPWRIEGNKILDRQGRTVLTVFATPADPFLRLIVAKVNSQGGSSAE